MVHQINSFMENLDILEKLGKVAGIAGIAVGALVLIFGGIIQKNVFPNMTKEQGFRIIRMMIVAASALAVVGIGAYIYTEYQKTILDKKGSLISKNLVGTIQNSSNLGVPSVKIYAVQQSDIADKSDSDGKYILRVDGNGESYFDVVFEHPQYQTVRKKIKVNFETEGTDIPVDLVILQTSYPPDAENILEPQVPPSQTHNPATENPKQNHNNSTASKTNITLKYMGDNFGCRINVNINVGGRSINPQSTTVVLTDVPLGDQNYSINGTIFCNNGSCNASGEDVLNITPNATYYLMWLNEDGDGHCDIGLLNEEQFQLINSAY